jgi:hypothetical protein
LDLHLNFARGGVVTSLRFQALFARRTERMWMGAIPARRTKAGHNGRNGSLMANVERHQAAAMRAPLVEAARAILHESAFTDA